VARASDAASMGPRSRERGNRVPPILPELWQAASMGPRSRERGNERQFDPGVDHHPGFNGAALT